MLKSIWTARWYILLGLVTFLIVLVITTPLHFVWRYAESKLQGLPVHISHVQGSLWKGTLRLTVIELPELGEITGQWQLQPWSLLFAKLQVNLNLETADLRLHLPVTLDSKQLMVSGGEGYFDLEPLKPILARGQGSAEGSIELNNFSTTVQLEPVLINSVLGNLTYSGGDISLLVDNKPVRAEMPPLVGGLSRDTERALLSVMNLEGETLVEGFVKDDGWGGLAIRRSFIDTLGQEWPMKADPEDIVFEVSRKVL